MKYSDKRDKFWFDQLLISLEWQNHTNLKPWTYFYNNLV